MRIRIEAVLFVIDIDANHRREEIFIDALGVVVNVIRMSFIAQRKVKVAIRPENYRAAVVIKFFVIL